MMKFKTVLCAVSLLGFLATSGCTMATVDEGDEDVGQDQQASSFVDCMNVGRTGSVVGPPASWSQCIDTDNGMDSL